MAIPPIASRQLSRLRDSQLVQRYKEHVVPRLTPLHYASALVLVLILLFNSPFRNGTASQLRNQHCLNLELAVEATAASMRHASSQKYPKGFCQRIPLHQSAPWIWNTQAQQILDATFDPLRDENSAWLKDAFRLLQPMALSTRGRPQHEVWGQFINKIELKLSEGDILQATDPIKVLVIGSHYDPSTSCSTTKGQSSTYNMDCSWIARLQGVADYYLGDGVVEIEFQSLEHATTSLMTHAIKTNQLGAQHADLIIYAMTTQELRRDALLADIDLERPIDMDARTTYYQRLLFRVQDFVRASQASQPCQDQPPPILLVDDYVGNLHDRLLIEYSMTRALQQVSDHYRIGYVSYPHLIRQLVLTDTDNSPWTPDWSHGKNAEHGRVAHVGILWTLLYNALEYTIDYCSHESDIVEYRKVQKSTKLAEDWVFDRVQQPVPYLDGGLLWTNVSPLWQASAEKLQERKRNVCAGRERQSKAIQCSLASWGRGPDGELMTSASTHALLRPYITKMTGFKILDGGILRATQPHAVFELVIRDETLDADQVAFFLGPGDLHALQNPLNQLDNAELKFSVAAGAVNATSSTVINVVDRLSWEQEIPENEPGRGIRLTFELVAGASIDITGIFLCTSDDVAFYGKEAWPDRVL